MRRPRLRLSRRHARDVGLAAAVGLDLEPEPSSVRALAGTECPRCRRPGRIDMIDTTAKRAYLSCPICASSWETSPTGVSS